TVTITAIQPRLRLSGTNRLGFQPSMAISGRNGIERCGFFLSRSPVCWMRVKHGYTDWPVICEFSM
ncbi:MAG: hypothetical protein KZQ65_04905, partial [Candidatus Thiodiazotropha sp. (ex Gloverina cf. vestifex)]|nr:hypothetical protein [Candidatus Thiodiazotropha sp. (ex Gloverina cf. vestifex)]